MSDEDFVFVQTPLAGADVDASNVSCIPLRSDHPSNFLFLQRQWCIWELYDAVDKLNTHEWPEVQNSRDALRLRLDDAWLELQDVQRQAWISQAHKLDAAVVERRELCGRASAYGLPDEVRTDRYMRSPLRSLDSLIAAICIISSAAILLCNISLSHCRFFLKSMRIPLRIALRRFGADTKEAMSVIEDIPTDARTAIKRLDLLYEYHVYVCCPSCYAVYADRGPDSYPEFCTNTPTGGAACLHNLTRQRAIGGKLYTQPVRRFVMHDLKEWLGHFLCRPGVQRSLMQTPRRKKKMRDVWDAPQLSAFKGLDGSQFLRVTQGETRLIFALNVDGFNPFQMKEAGRKATVTAMYLICLNLPPHMRYKVENMFLIGIIPGPKDPSKEQFNPVLALLVRDLLPFWLKGVFFTRTPLHDAGLLVRLALFLVVCDSPAGRDVSGFARHNHTHFCPYCELLYQQRNNLDTSTWIPRSLEKHRNLAEEWRSGGPDERDDIYDDHGIRWSALLELPYFDPLRCTVIDMMHVLFLGNLKRLCRHYWNMSASLEDGDGTGGGTASLPRNERMLDEIWRHVRASPKEKLDEFTLNDLRGLVSRKNVPMPMTMGPRASHKVTFIDALVLYRIEQGWFNADDVLLQPPEPSMLPHDPLQIIELDAHPAEIDALQELFLCAPDSQIFYTFTVKVLRAFLVWKMGLSPDEYGAKSERVTLSKLRSKKPLVKRIVELRHRAGYSDAVGFIRHPDPERYTKALARLPGNGRSAILGKNRLAEVWSDMDRTVIPTWVGHAPHRFGDKQHRKAGADDYRIFVTINLVITMIRLWGPLHPGSRERALLNNLMDLVSATNLASSRVIDDECVEKYHESMLAWLQGLVTLFPGVLIESQQHLSLHLSYFLLSLGPTHAWRCFVFERWNYLLQQINTNNQFGSLERTLFDRFIQNQLLRAMILDGGLAPELQEFKPIFEECFESDKRGTLLSDILALAPEEDETAACILSRNPRVTREDLDPSTIQQLSEVVRSAGDTFSLRCVKLMRSATVGTTAYSVNSPDCYVAIGSLSGEWRLARIVQALSYSFANNVPTSVPRQYVVVRFFASLTEEDRAYDWYREWPLHAGQLHYAEIEEDFYVIPARDIICHCCVTEWEQWFGVPRPVVHALPMKRE
ncbi:unnamed protein product [Peniophora sp. CBMAI 1063]|nr:unnamed protein product [Peniophora sp. CBMAI 1063]